MTSNAEKSSPAEQINPVASINEVGHGNIRALPGESVLVDIDHKHSGAHDKDDVVLVPAPSSDRSDPLNWSMTRKYTDMGIVCFWAFMLGSTTLSPNVAYASLIAQWGIDATFINIGTAVMLFNLGFFNIFFSPLSEIYGRRPVYMFSTLLCVVSQIISAAAPNKAAWMVGRVLLGAGAAPFEQLPALTVDDIFFVHQRGLGLSLYVLAIASGSFLGPIASGFVVQNMGWQWLYWFHAIILGLVFGIILVGLEETTFERHHAPQGVTNEDGERCISGPVKGYWASRKLFVVNRSRPSLLRLILSAFRVMNFPIVLWCGFMYGLAVTWLTIMAATIVEVFMAPPYLFSVSNVGLVMIAPLIGTCVSLYAGGAGTDRFLVWTARRNGGVMKSEARLYAIFIGGPLMGAGLWLYGIGAANSINWVGLVFGMGLIGTGLPLAAELALGYSIEAYPLLASEVSVAVIFLRNSLGAGLTFAIAPWIKSSGLQNTFIVVGLLAFFGMVSGSLLIVWGENCRRRSASTYWSLASRLNRTNA